MSDRKWPVVDMKQYAAPSGRQSTPMASRTAVLVMVVFVLLVVSRIVVVEYRKEAENMVDRREERKQQIVRWIEQNFGSPDAKVVSYSDLREELFKNERWLEVMVGQLNKPAQDQFCICRFTFDRSGKVLAVSQRPVR